MDPFGSVLQDAERQLGSAQLQLRQYRAEPRPALLADLQNTIEELMETVRDLSGSIAAVQKQPEEFGLSHVDISLRIDQVGRINNQVTDIQEALARIRDDNRAPAAWEPEFRSDPEAQTASVSAEDRQMLFQETIRDQDTILTGVEQTVATLREQANLMSSELQDQAVLIDDFEQQVDHSNDRLRTGMKRVDYVLRNNRECMSNCCIIMLTVALIILLVLVIIA